MTQKIQVKKFMFDCRGIYLREEQQKVLENYGKFCNFEQNFFAHVSFGFCK